MVMSAFQTEVNGAEFKPPRLLIQRLSFLAAKPGATIMRMNKDGKKYRQGGCMPALGVARKCVRTENLDQTLRIFKHPLPDRQNSLHEGSLHPHSGITNLANRYPQGTVPNFGSDCIVYGDPSPQVDIILLELYNISKYQADNKDS